MNIEMAKMFLAHGAYLTHTYFSANEFIHQHGTRMIMEDGASTDVETFWSDRPHHPGAGFYNGWSFIYRDLEVGKTYKVHSIIQLDEEVPEADILILNDGYWMPLAKYFNHCRPIDSYHWKDDLNTGETYLPGSFTIEHESVDSEGIVHWLIKTDMPLVAATPPKLKLK